MGSKSSKIKDDKWVRSRDRGHCLVSDHLNGDFSQVRDAQDDISRALSRLSTGLHGLEQEQHRHETCRSRKSCAGVPLGAGLCTPHLTFAHLSLRAMWERLSFWRREIEAQKRNNWPKITQLMNEMRRMILGSLSAFTVRTLCSSIPSSTHGPDHAIHSIFHKQFSTLSALERRHQGYICFLLSVWVFKMISQSSYRITESI